MNILIAEQDRDFSKAFSFLLGLDNNTVTTVYDGTQVISRIEGGQSFDIAIVDESIPRISAKTLIPSLLARNVPVIVLISGKLTASRLMGSPLANAYLSLPFLPGDLTGLIKRVTENVNSTSKLSFEDVSITPSDFKLCGSVPVTEGEIELFDSIVKHEQVSGKHIAPYISALNYKLEKLNKHFRIKYLINEGYRMVKIQTE